MKHKSRKHNRRTPRQVVNAKRIAKISGVQSSPVAHEVAQRLGGDVQAPVLLTAVAKALNACERAGVFPQLAHGAVITEYGYVLWIPHKRGVNTPGESWQVRTRQLTETPLTLSDDD